MPYWSVQKLVSGAGPESSPSIARAARAPWRPAASQCDPGRGGRALDRTSPPRRRRRIRRSIAVRPWTSTGTPRETSSPLPASQPTSGRRRCRPPRDRRATTRAVGQGATLRPQPLTSTRSTVTTSAHLDALGACSAANQPPSLAEHALEREQQPPRSASPRRRAPGGRGDLQPDETGADHGEPRAAARAPRAAIAHRRAVRSTDTLS